MTDYQTRVNDAKVSAVDTLKAMFAEANDYVFTNFRGLSVDQITRLRTQLRESGAEYRVVKNNYAKIAFQQMEKPDVSEYLEGPTAIAISRTDAAPVVKVLVDFAKDAPVEVKGALVGDMIFNAAQAEAFSKLPSRDALIAQLMSVMQAPLQNFVYALNAVPTDLARVLQAVADKKNEE
ncbi:MAG: 50S ribosomal protein L10 [Spirochaeta sp.]|jgi:large subunit ribosomal protein L10|nr:50S ribosomal protein L10 [Spirochaeta sp.]